MALAQKRNTRQTTILLAAFSAVVIGGAIYLLVTRTQSNVGGQAGVTSLRKNDLPLLNDFGEDLYRAPRYKALFNFLSNTTPPDTTNVNAPQGNPEPFRTD